LKGFLVDERAHRVAQRLAPLREGGRDDLREERVVARARAVFAEGLHEHHGGVDLRRRREGPGRHAQQERHREAILQHHREAAVGFGAGLRHHPLDHFLLQHEDRVAHAIGEIGHPEEDRRRDVVGQVTDDAQRRGKDREIEFERVGLVHRELVARIFARKCSGQVAVDLDGVQFPERENQLPREDAGPGTDLHHGVAGLRADRLHDAPHVMTVGEEVLAEAFPGAGQHARS
jgi:hypothetical protein